MQKNNVILAIILVFGIIAAMAPPITAPPSFDVVYVDDEALGDGHFNDIPSALGAVMTGGTMYIAAGHYVLSSSLVINSDLTVIGDGQDMVLIDAEGGGFSIFFVDGADFELSGCSLTGGFIGVELIMRNNTVDISGNAIYGNGRGINASMSSPTELPALDGDISEENNLTIYGNEIFDNENQGIGISTLMSFNTVDIVSNDIYGNGYSGIGIGGDASTCVLSVGHNAIHENGVSSSSSAGIYVHELANLMLYLDIFGNQIYGEGGDGIYLSGNTDAYSDYMWFWAQESISIYENHITGCGGNGINMDMSMQVYDSGPDILDGDPEVYGCEAEYVAVYKNTVANNLWDGMDIDFEMQVQYVDPVLWGAEEDFFQVSAILTVAENEIYGNGGKGISAYLVDDYTPAGPPESLDGSDPNYIETFLWACKNEIYDNGISGIYLQGLPCLIENNLIVGNFRMPELDGQSPGRGIFMFDCDEAFVLNNTLIANLIGIDYESCDPYIFNNIVASNLHSGIYAWEIPPLGYDGNGTLRIAFNDVWGNGANYLGVPDMTGIYYNISEDPRFFGMYDARLLPISPCIDTGLIEVIYIVSEDIAGTPRPQGPGIDMGCYEMYDQVWSPRYIQPLAILSTANASAMWGCILDGLPADLEPGAVALIEDIQALMGQAGSLSNPVYTNGLMQQALALMGDLNDILECGCQ